MREILQKGVECPPFSATWKYTSMSEVSPEGKRKGYGSYRLFADSQSKQSSEGRSDGNLP